MCPFLWNTEILPSLLQIPLYKNGHHKDMCSKEIHSKDHVVKITGKPTSLEGGNGGYHWSIFIV